MSDERKGRMSFKWKIECREHQPMLDYVFAATEEEARSKAKTSLDIPEDEQFVVFRVRDVENLSLRLV